MIRIGTSLTSAHTVDDPRNGARMMIERARAANEAGLDLLFVGDHHATPAPYYQNVPIMGRLLAEWSDKPFGCLFLLPLWNPVLVAEQVSTLAALGRGRFILQCALGAGRGQFGPMGANLGHRPSLFEEGLDIVRRLLAGETVSADGRYQFERARISPVPAEPVEVWIGGSAEPSIDRAARLGDGWLAGPELTPDAAIRWLTFYRERCVAHGREPEAVAIRRDVYVGSDEAEVARVAGPVIEGGYRGFDPEALVIGTADQVAERFAALGDAGFTDVIVRHIAVPQADVLASIGRLERVRTLLA